MLVLLSLEKFDCTKIKKINDGPNARVMHWESINASDRSQQTSCKCGLIAATSHSEINVHKNLYTFTTYAWKSNQASWTFIFLCLVFIILIANKGKYRKTGLKKF